MILTSELKIALSILLGFAMVAVAIVASGTSVRSLPGMRLFSSQTLAAQYSPERTDVTTRILYGNKKATTKVIEFADFQCPYCSQLHSTLKQLVDESNGTILWEYRQFPLSIHPNALPAAHYAECVADIAGDDAFWKYADILMHNQSSLTDTFLSSSAQGVGVNTSQLKDCLANAKIQSRITTDTQTAAALGGTGTPFTVIVYPDGSTKPVSGALPYAQWKLLLKK